MSDEAKKEHPGIVEKYTSATHASSLVVSPDRPGAADSLIAAGWSKSRLGAQLMRLHSEADATSEPLRLPEHTMQVLARTIAEERITAARGAGLQGADRVTDADREEARRQAGEWYLREHALRLQRLKTLPEARDQLALWAAASNIGKPLDVATGAIQWWLNSRCHVCHGQRWQVVPGTPKLSGRPCNACNGTGNREMPHGVATKLVLAYISDCVNAARESMKQRLRHTIGPRATGG